MQQNNDLLELGQGQTQGQCHEAQGQSQSSTTNGTTETGTSQIGTSQIGTAGIGTTGISPMDLPPLALAMEQILDKKLAALEERLFSRLSHQVALSEQRLTELIMRQTGSGQTGSGVKPGASGEGGMDLD